MRYVRNRTPVAEEPTAPEPNPRRLNAARKMELPWQMTTTQTGHISRSNFRKKCWKLELGDQLGKKFCNVG